MILLKAKPPACHRPWHSAFRDWNSKKPRARPSRRAGLYVPRRLPSRYRQLAVHSVQLQGLRRSSSQGFLIKKKSIAGKPIYPVSIDFVEAEGSRFEDLPAPGIWNTATSTAMRSAEGAFHLPRRHRDHKEVVFIGISWRRAIKHSRRWILVGEESDRSNKWFVSSSSVQHSW